jgi:methionyl-tRNA formyltransferase
MRVVFVGTGEIGLPTLRWLIESAEHELVAIVTQPDKPSGRDQRLTPPAIKSAAAGLGIPILQPERIKRPEAVAAIQQLLPEVIVVMAYGQILPKAVLEIPRVACLNLHASLLPRHRGAAPIQAAILAGDEETGITVMYMDEGLDTGDELLKVQTPISPTDTGGTLHDRLATIAPPALAEALQLLANGTAPRIPQENAAATYAPKLEREHGAIDVAQPAAHIARMIRAFDPWPGAYLLLPQKLKLFGAARVADTQLPAGKVAPAADGISLLIGAGDGGIEVPEVQLEGRKRMTGAELLRGHPWIAG